MEVVKRLVSDGYVRGAYIQDCPIKETCDVCAQGKMTRLKFPKIAQKHSKAPLDLVHSDVCGPMQTETPSQKRYILTFIDDFTRYGVIYLLRSKSDVFEKLEEYIEMTTTMFNRRVKLLRWDRGGEYTGKQIAAHLKSKGIRVQYTAPFTPEQNGIAGRKNRTLVEMARCMLIDGKCEKQFWGEAVAMANYMQNRMPTKGADVTPFEGWFTSVKHSDRNAPCISLIRSVVNWIIRPYE